MVNDAAQATSATDEDTRGDFTPSRYSPRYAVVAGSPVGLASSMLDAVIVERRLVQVADEYLPHCRSI
jgi:hypothetical protein